MKCTICGSENGIFAVIGLEEKVCAKCNEYLNKYTYGNPVVAKAYFDTVVFDQNLDEKTERFLETKYREHKGEISDSQVEAAKKSISRKLVSNLPNTNPSETEAKKMQSAISSNFSNGQSTEYDDFHRELKRIEESVEAQNNNIKIIKNILIFFAIIAVIGMISSLIYTIQLSNFIKEFFELSGLSL